MDSISTRCRGMSCPRCGLEADVLSKLLPVPGASADTFTQLFCSRCEQAIVMPPEERPNGIHGRRENAGFAAPFEYSRSLVYVPGSYRCMPAIHPITDAVLSRIREVFVPRKSDIWLATYPKCGTTWVQNILSHLFQIKPSQELLSRPVQVGLQLTDDMLWLDALCGIHGPDEVLALVNAMPTDKPRLFKSHNPLGLLEPVVALGAKVVHVARNPKGT